MKKGNPLKRARTCEDLSKKGILRKKAPCWKGLVFGIVVIWMSCGWDIQPTAAAAAVEALVNEKGDIAEKPVTKAVFDRSWELIETYAHDTASFTQGLEVSVSCKRPESCSASENSCVEPRILVTESTGNHGTSLVRTWDLVSGEVLKETKMEDRFFGEGATQYTDDTGKELLAVLTYKEETILVYDANTLEHLETISPWPSPTTTREGWGIAFDPVNRIFVVSDGSAMLHYWDLKFQAISSRPPVTVHIDELVDDNGRVMVPHKEGENGTAIHHINELEWDPVTNTLLANRWIDNIILRIDPVSGVILRIYDVSALHERVEGEDVMNGIAILPFHEGKEWLLTGKWWPQMYRIKVSE